MSQYKEYTVTMTIDGEDTPLVMSSKSFLDVTRQADAHAGVIGADIVSIVAGRALTDGDVTIHDIRANGTNYIMEWFHGDNDDGRIAITETCNVDDGEVHLHKAYDFKEFVA